ncbi:MAG TPA: alpha/beta fold hydrolase [Thermoanaerobaculia bacterium]|nr:alpha/beta fold hydrolase [Thermoanaerobaculia bacterium]
MARSRRVPWFVVTTLAAIVLVAFFAPPPMFDPLLHRLLYPAPPLAVGEPPPGLTEVVLDAGAGRVVAWAGGHGASAGRPTVLFFHGNGENLETMKRAGLFDDLERLGVAYLAIDYPGYGRSGGAANEKTLAAAAEAALDWARQAHPRRPVVAAGWSLGAAVAVELLARHPEEVAGAALLSPWTRLADVAAIHFPAPLVRPYLAGRYDTLAVAPEIERPVLVIHGGADRIIPAEQGERVAAAFSGPVRWRRIERADHNDLLLFPEVWQELSGFFASFGS